MSYSTEILTLFPFNCKFCGNSFNYRYSKYSQLCFCSPTCARSYSSNIRRNEVNIKVSYTVLKKFHKIDDNKEIEDRRIESKKDRYLFRRKYYPESFKRPCKYCGETDNKKKSKSICETCKNIYYSFYRPSCEFSFDLNEFKDIFDFRQVKQYGWYSPSNKGDNLKGVSKDHRYSVKQGFINKVDPEIIKHPVNCKLMVHSENSSKNSNCSVTLDQLIFEIIDFEFKKQKEDQ